MPIRVGDRSTVRVPHGHHQECEPDWTSPVGCRAQSKSALGAEQVIREALMSSAYSELEGWLAAIRSMPL